MPFPLPRILRASYPLLPARTPMKNKSDADKVEHSRRKTQLIADGLEYDRRWRATEEIFDRICVERGRYRKENVGIAAQKTALSIRGYLRSARVWQIRRQSGGATPKALPAPQSSVNVLRRMRRALETDNPYTFRRAGAELPQHVRRRLLAIGRNDEDEKESWPIFDPWSLLFLYGPNGKHYGKALPAKADCIRVFDTVIEQAGKPGRRGNVALRCLVTELIIRWANITKSDLREPAYLTATSQRAGPLAHFIRELGEIWNVQLVSTNSGSSMRKAILAARQKLGV
jgi:hypothetical protein